MVRSLSTLLSLIVLFFASCEDKEKTGNKSSNTTTTIENTEEFPPSKSNEESETEKQEEEKSKEDDGPLLVQEELIPFLTEYGEENPENKIRISTRFGDIDVLLYNNTPLHRANFIFLAKQGYFDGTFFHRVAEGFVIQGGNSDNTETSKKRNKIGSYLVPGEFEAGHRHSRGAFSAAKYAKQNVSKASSPYEFFIVQSERGAHHLDNDHTVFGRVTSGMDVVDEINRQVVGEGEWPDLNIPITVKIFD